MLFKILNGFYLIWSFYLQKIGRKGFQKKRNFSLSSKMCRSLASRSFQRFVLRKRFFTKIFKCLKNQFFCKFFSPFAKLKTSEHFWNQRKIPLFYTLCGLFWRNFFSILIRGSATCFGGLRSNIEPVKYFKKCFFIN